MYSVFLCDVLELIDFTSLVNSNFVITRVPDFDLVWCIKEGSFCSGFLSERRLSVLMSLLSSPGQAGPV